MIIRASRCSTACRARRACGASSLGTYPRLKPARARQLATEVLDQVRAGIDPGLLSHQAKQKRRPADIGSIDALVRDYLRQHIAPNCSGGTYHNAKRMLEVDILSSGASKLDSISKRDAIALIDRIAEDRPVHANRVLARLRAMFNWAVAKDRIAASPIAGLKAPSKEKSRDRWLDDQEIVWFWQACERHRLSVRPAVSDLAVDGATLGRNRVHGMGGSSISTPSCGSFRARRPNPTAPMRCSCRCRLASCCARCHGLGPMCSPVRTVAASPASPTARKTRCCHDGGVRWCRDRGLHSA